MLQKILSDWCDAAEHDKLLTFAAQSINPTPDAVWKGINRLAFALGECEAKSPLERKLVGLVMQEITQDRLAALIIAKGKHEAGKDWKSHLEKFGSRLSERFKAFRPMVDDLYPDHLHWLIADVVKEVAIADGLDELERSHWFRWLADTTQPFPTTNHPNLTDSIEQYWHEVRTGRMPHMLATKTVNDLHRPFAHFDDGENEQVEETKTAPTTTEKQRRKRKTPYELLADHAEKHWSKATDSYRLVSCLKNGECDYQTLLDILLPKCKRADQTKRFHAVKSVVNKHLAATGAKVEIYKQQRGQLVSVQSVGKKVAKRKV